MARLYLCDDDSDYRALLRLVLAPEHEIVGEGVDGQEAVEQAAGTEPDVVLLDLNMPRMSGFDALPPLRAALPDTKILVLSSARRQDELQRVLGLGADGYIEKPHDIMSLNAQIQAELDAA